MIPINCVRCASSCQIVYCVRWGRDSLSTTTYPLTQLLQAVADALKGMQSTLFANAQARQQAQTVCVTDAESLKHAFADRRDASIGHLYS